MHRLVKMTGVVLLMCANAVHAAKTATCLTRPEATALVTAVFPDIIDGLVKVCAPVLPDTANLRGGLTLLMARYRPAADAAWPQAYTAVEKLAGEDMRGVEQTALKPIFGPILANLIAKDIKPANCPQIDRVVGGLAPLAPQNLADVVVAMLELDRSKGKRPDLSICPAEPTAP